MSRDRAETRLARLLAIVPWVAAHDGPPVAEVCRRFGVDEKNLLADLQLLFMCGVHPFTPDVLIDVDIADGRVWIRMADYFRRPLRLNPQEGLALASAASAFLEVPGADPEGALATALDKLRTVLGVGADDGLDVELGAVPAGVLESLRRAVDSRRKVHLEYYSFGRDGHSSRVVQPWRVFNSNGQWYLAGWCELAEGERLFRVDRITGANLLPDTFSLPAEAARAPGDVFHPGAEDPRVVLDLDPAAHWIAEQYPHDRVVDRGGGVLRVTLPAGQRAWLERLLLRAGPAVRVVEGDAEVGALAAARLLARYRPAQPVG
jgi:predicted DNA-binding transcriptional regulator YafY